MINSKPNNKNYHQGNFVPTNKDKVLKLNSEGGSYYRSSLEKKMMIWLDNHEKVVTWGAECLKIPYQLTHYLPDGDIKLKNHTYFPDFYYEMKGTDGFNKKVVAEVKPQKEYLMVVKLQEGKIESPKNKATLKKMKNLEYDVKMAHKNKKKWESMIKFCDLKGYKFVVITEKHLR